jgi:hypothetical protein
MSRIPAVFLSGLSVLAAALPVLGQEGSPQTFEAASTGRVSFAAGGTVRINGSYGYLSVDGWDDPSVEVAIIKSTDSFYEPGQQAEAKQRLERIRVVTERRSDRELSVTTILASRNGDWSPPLPSTTKAGVTVELRIHVPRDSRLVVHHDTGYVWVSDVTGGIDLRSHTGDMIVMLPDPGLYSIDARTALGGISSDFTGTGHNRFVVGTRFTGGGNDAAQRVFLRMGRGNITIKKGPPSATNGKTEEVP